MDNAGRDGEFFITTTLATRLDSLPHTWEMTQIWFLEGKMRVSELRATKMRRPQLDRIMV